MTTPPTPRADTTPYRSLAPTPHQATPLPTPYTTPQYSHHHTRISDQA